MQKHNISKYRIYIFLIFFLAFYFTTYIVYNNNVEAPSEDFPADAPAEDGTEKIPRYKEAILMAGGDIMVHTPQLSQAKDPQTGEYDFSPSFEYITDHIQKADLAVANFESTLAGEDRGYDGYPLFNSPDELADNLKDAGFDLMCTANNHSLDRGEKALYRTIEVFEDAGLPTFGTARTREERDTPLIIDVNGINIAFLAYTDSTNGIPVPAGKDYIINFIDLNSDPNLINAEITFNEDIARARDAGADLIAVYMHWGLEYRFSQNDWQMNLAQLLAKAGADLILGSHPHVIQPMEYITVKQDDGSYHEAFVAYSMGNFISNQHYIAGAIPTEEVKYGMLLKIHLEKDNITGKAYIDDVEYILTWVNRDRRHRILPLHEAIQSSPESFNIPHHKHNRLQPVWDNTEQRLEGFEPAYRP